jgi:quinol monooxygenase YgiN
MSDPGVILVAEVHGLAGTVVELRALLAELADGARGEPECVGFRVLAAEDPGDFVLLASWRSESALRAHYDTAHYRRYDEQVGGLLARPSEVVVHHIAATIHPIASSPPDPGELG